MQAKEYRTLAAELKKEGTFEARTLYGLATIGLELGLFGIAAAALYHVKPWSLPFVALEIFLGLSMFRFFVIVHECGHKSLFETARGNALAGTIASIFCLVPAVPWRQVHMLHHKWVGVIDKDPTQKALLRLKGYGAGMNLLFRVIWKLWLPVMYLMFIFDVFWGWSFREIAKKDGDRKQAIRGFGSMFVIAAPHLALLFTLGIEKWAVLFLPMFYVFLFVDENVSLPQHTGLFPYLSKHHPNPIPFHEQDGVTRTTNGAGLLSMILAYNFTLHTEHHLFPSVPWYRLPKVAQRIERLPTYRCVQFAQYMVSIRLRDPVDVYTKALPDEADDDAPESAPLPTN